MACCIAKCYLSLPYTVHTIQSNRADVLCMLPRLQNLLDEVPCIALISKLEEYTSSETLIQEDTHTVMFDISPAIRTETRLGCEMELPPLARPHLHRNSGEKDY